MRIRFWGTRGSLPKPGPTTLRYGGNTSCVELNTDAGQLIIFDSGTGIHELGRALMASGRTPLAGRIFISHTHWDHIQGFPFFTPAFVPGNSWDIYAPTGLNRRLEDTLAGQMEYTYFPVTLDQLGATIRFHELAEGTLKLGESLVRMRYLNHPAITMGYRFESGGGSFVYATDHEPHSRHAVSDDAPAESTSPIHKEDAEHVAFLAGADLVVHDAQYTLEEYRSKVGWGHSPAETVVDLAIQAGVKRLALFHHDPARSDDALDSVLETCRQRARNAGSSLDVLAAAEGLVVEVREMRADSPAPETHHEESRPQVAAPENPAVLIVDDDPDIVDIIRAALEPDGYRLFVAANGASAIDVARQERPDLILLDWILPDAEGPEVCLALRATAPDRGRAVPILMLTSKSGAQDTATGFTSGASDYITKPFNPSHLRTRVQQWLVRSGHAQSR